MTGICFRSNTVTRRENVPYSQSIPYQYQTQMMPMLQPTSTNYNVPMIPIAQSNVPMLTYNPT